MPSTISSPSMFITGILFVDENSSNIDSANSLSETNFSTSSGYEFLNDSKADENSENFFMPATVLRIA